ncbi:hypothetical protein Y1Q_0023823 [Alligator mississippiensis]|uniref:Uncharacterized protein n=1 Tax=Alligator mississippiensis TaxID=8496 RepID=A0A151MKA8_ALLMI|nr:hypothetical protein Y1Q_0023823 [Alligator mississippiensis]
MPLAGSQRYNSNALGFVLFFAKKTPPARKQKNPGKQGCLLMQQDEDGKYVRVNQVVSMMLWLNEMGTDWRRVSGGYRARTSCLPVR